MLDELTLPDLPLVDISRCLPYDAIRYVPGFTTEYVREFARTAQLEAFRLGVEAAALQAEKRAADVRKANTRGARIGAAALFVVDQLELCASAIRSIPQPKEKT